MAANRRIMRKGYADILCGIYFDPATVNGIAKRHGLNRQSVGCVIRRMRDLGVVHVGAWRIEGAARIPAAVLHYGPGTDAPPPFKADGTRYDYSRKRSQRLKVRPELLTFCNLVKALEEPHSINQLAEIVGIGCHTAATRQLLNHMHAIGMVHVAEYERTAIAGKWTRLFAIGFGLPDAVKPKPMNAKELGKRRWQQTKSKKFTLQVCHALAGTTQPREAAFA